MNIDSLKLSLWNEIASINDETVLQKLKKQIAKLIDNESVETDSAYVKDIELSLKDSAKGKVYTQKEVEKKVKSWAKQTV